MTQQDRELLLKDLCARLPYHPILKWINCEGKSVDRELTDLSDVNLFFICKSETNEVKPYLCPMSGMTEEEKEEYDEWHLELESGRIKDWKVADYIDWLNAHHFDYRGLIEKGLALEAPKDMYK